MKRTDKDLAEELALGYLETLDDEELEASVGGAFSISRPSLGIAEALA